MASSKQILIIHATDADQHLSRLKKILEALKAENRIETYALLESDSFTKDSVKISSGEDGAILLLSTGIGVQKDIIEETLLKFKEKHPQSKIIEIIVDNIPYEQMLITFPQDLQPIRAREDMDSVWTQIAGSLRDMFPAPVPIPANPSWWEKYKKFVLYSIGILLLLLLLIWIIGRSTGSKFEILNTQVQVDPVNHSGNCPQIFDFQAKIMANKAGKVLYQWLRSDNTSTPPETLIFRSGGSEIINNQWSVGTSGRYWQQLQILSPDVFASDRLVFSLRCIDPIVPISGSFQVRQTWSGDFDRGREVPSSAPASEKDFWFQARTATDRVITRQNDAIIARLPVNNSPTLESVKTALSTGSTNEIDVRSLIPGVWVAIRTSEGNYAAFMLLESVGPSPGLLNVRYLVWKK